MSCVTDNNNNNIIARPCETDVEAATLLAAGWAKNYIQAVYIHIALAPKYLSDCVSTVSAASGRYRLRSTGSAAYVLPRTRTKFRERGFFYSGPAAWNTLPSDLHDITDTSTFMKRLKNVLFDRAYNWLLLALLDESYSGTLQILRWLIDWLIDGQQVLSYRRDHAAGREELALAKI